MPRKESYNKHARIEAAKRKRYFQSLSRDFNMKCLKDTFKMLDEDNSLLANDTNLKYLTNKLYDRLSEPMSQYDLVKASNILMLLWERLEKNGSSGK